MYEATENELQEIDQMPIRRLVDLDSRIARAWGCKNHQSTDDATKLRHYYDSFRTYTGQK